ncbi:hypothetical protein ANN_17931 [Periplaneta americana]|uniref:Uncharacterized protein n=1 Tax=Periplaneta americana TaxID=6978 RepID=A0ABQ8SNL4_PERAM|nr:hypothetical protein ANN_17931 [Periplaneta americana]
MSEDERPSSQEKGYGPFTMKIKHNKPRNIDDLRVKITQAFFNKSLHLVCYNGYGLNCITVMSYAGIPTRNTILRWVASFRITGSTLKKKSPGRNSIALRLSEATPYKIHSLRLVLNPQHSYPKAGTCNVESKSVCSEIELYVGNFIWLLAFKESGGSLPPSHKPAIGPYPEQD